jgi:diketogulonate reductase-like aldo/keto reductase
MVLVRAPGLAARAGRRSFDRRSGLAIAPIPGTKHVARVEENIAADRIELSAAQVERLNNLTPAAGARHNDANMAVIDR